MKHVIQCIVCMLFFVLKLSRDLLFLHTVSSLHSVTTIILEYIIVYNVKQIKMDFYYSK